MRNFKCILFAITAFFSLHSLQAQDKSNYKFGKITPADFNLTAMKFDSGANAVIIADVGSTTFEGNNKGRFTLVFTRYMRVKIMNKNGFDAGNHQISLYHNSDGDVERISSLKGSTFNLENGVVSETKLDEKSVFNEKYNKNLDLRKFSMPALKEGSIFDLIYTIKSPFETELRPWAFQSEYPCLWSEYEVVIPPPFHYVMSLQGDQNFDVNTTKAVYSNYSIREENGTSQADIYNISGSSIDQRWVKKNVFALHEEPYTTTLDNYNSRVAFQLNYIQWTQQSEKHDYMTTWETRSKALLEDEEFGLALNYENNWMSDELKGITADAQSEKEKAYKIFCYIRDNFKSTSDHGLYAHNPLKTVFKSKQGNVAEINLLLTAMLRKSGIDADPVILSTRDNGIASATYPLISQYDYVICIAYIDKGIFYLDASRPFNGFGQLTSNCYNGWGHIINEQKPLPVPLFSDSVKETSITNVLIFNDDKGKSSGAYKSVLGRSESFDVRKEISESSEKSYAKKIQTESSSDIAIENFGVDSLHKFDFPLSVHYDFDIKNLGSTDVLYFNPMFGEEYKTNPFKAFERHYPVEVPYMIDEMYLLTMDVPAGYQIDELPKSARVAYNDKEGLFEYLIQKGEGNLQMRVHLKLNKAFFPVDEYPTLRDFFAFVVKKESEQIVFKKIK
jgi:Domain of Unknown Function with PDB structure (DUF3858)/Transglutaminase-like superfamily